MSTTAGRPADYNPGDLGRRVAERRQQLGLNREELAQRAGIAPQYLAHLEQQATARPSPAACARLAAVLGTTVSWLRGGGLGGPPGRDPAPAGVPVLEELGEPESLALLEPGGVGRVVFTDERGPVALPVNFRTLDREVYFRTGHGSIARTVEAGGTVSVEVDHLDEAQGEGWSVLVTGGAAFVTDAGELARVQAQHVEPWAGGDRDQVVRVAPGKVTGRRIRRRPPEEP